MHSPVTLQLQKKKKKEKKPIIPIKEIGFTNTNTFSGEKFTPPPIFLKIRTPM